MNEKDFQYILTVAQCGSFSRAAETLYVSQPSLSRYISTLEKDWGPPYLTGALRPFS